MNRYKCIVAYDGTEFGGWQIQPKVQTVQEHIENALKQITGEEIGTFVSGRTDAGVHAMGQVFHFDSNATLDLHKFTYGLNAVLPEAIRIKNTLSVAPDFDARFAAKSKEYRYFIENAPIVMPCDRLYRWHVRQELDANLIRQAITYLIGEHDFAAFSANPDRELESTVRTIYSLEWKAMQGAVEMRIVGSGFLYKMVRSIVGWLIEIGRKKAPPQRTLEILNQAVRSEEVPTAPPQGLFLWRVNY